MGPTSGAAQLHTKKATCRYLAAVMLLVLATLVQAPRAQAQVSVSIGHPGFYGRIEIGALTPPPLLYPQPVIIVPKPAAPPPIYLRVPPGHSRHWSKHCHRYGACSRPVYFVEERWYHEVYVPHHHHHRHEQGRGKGHKGHGHKRHDHKHGKGHKKH